MLFGLVTGETRLSAGTDAFETVCRLPIFTDDNAGNDENQQKLVDLQVAVLLFQLMQIEGLQSAVGECVGPFWMPCRNPSCACCNHRKNMLITLL